MIDLLQISDSLTKAAQTIAGDSNHDGHLSFFELLKMGGWIMIPLGIMLLLAVYVFAERMIAIRNAARIDATRPMRSMALAKQDETMPNGT